MESAEPDLEDLLGGEDDEVAEDEELLGVEEVAHLAAAADKPVLDMMDIDGLARFDTRDTDSEEEEEVRGERERRRREEVERRRAAMYERLNIWPPGLDLFTARGEAGGFTTFSLDTLSLEADFGYSRRGKLLGHGLTKEQVDSILGEPRQLVRHLMPEAQTVLICDKEDYKAIMNYLYYAVSVCACPRLNSLLTRAFFDLRRNYGFRWSLSLRHVFTVLLNYGANEKVIFCEDFYNDDKTGIRKHLEEVRKSGQREAPSSYSLPKLPTFFERRRRAGAPGRPVDDASFLLCLTRFLRLLADFSAGLQAYQEFRHKNNWSDQVITSPHITHHPLQVILLYLMLLVGTDRRLVRELAAQEAVTTLLHFHLDSFHSSHWRWGPTKKADSQASKAAGFNHSSVCKTLVRLVNEFFPGEGGREAVAAWEAVPGRPRVTDDSGASDHHLNMLHRLHLLPPSHRGNQVRRYLAYLYLQTLACLPYSLPHTVGLAELAANPQLHYHPAKERQEENKFCEGIKLILLSKNYDMVMTVVELYDTVVGEVEEGGEQVGEQVEVLRRGVLEWVRRKCPGLQQRGLDEETVRRMQLAEYIDIVDGRWQAMAS